MGGTHGTLPAWQLTLAPTAALSVSLLCRASVSPLSSGRRLPARPQCAAVSRATRCETVARPRLHKSQDVFFLSLTFCLRRRRRHPCQAPAMSGALSFLLRQNLKEKGTQNRAGRGSLLSSWSPASRRPSTLRRRLPGSGRVGQPEEVIVSWGAAKAPAGQGGRKRAEARGRGSQVTEPARRSVGKSHSQAPALGRGKGAEIRGSD